MKINFFQIVLVASFLFSLQLLNAQIFNWNAVENTRHIVNIGVGLDYSVSYNAGYSYKLNTKTPVVLTTSFSLPSGELILDDFKSKIGGQLLIINNPHFKGGVAINGIFRRFENPLVRLLNFGSETKANFGYYGLKWFIAAEIGFDKAIVSHFKHSDYYKENYYEDVKDGWYEPSTGGNLQYGLQTGYSFKKSDITLSLGKVVAQDFKTNPTLPFYMGLGYNFRFLQ